MVCGRRGGIHLNPTLALASASVWLLYGGKFKPKHRAGHKLSSRLSSRRGAHSARHRRNFELEVTALLMQIQAGNGLALHPLTLAILTMRLHRTGTWL